MWFFNIIMFVFTSCFAISCVESQVLYYCNFDNSTASNNCFTAWTTSIVASHGLINSSPKAPLSDVTAITKPAKNGYMCKIPYSINAEEIYFCYVGDCETINNGEQSECEYGKYALFTLGANTTKTVQLKIPSASTTSVGPRCLSYYYHMSTENGDSLTVRKVHSNGVNDTIDTVTRIPSNRWIQRNVSFDAVSPHYDIFFDMKATSGRFLPFTALDEISISVGHCIDHSLATGVSTSSGTISSTGSSTSTITTTTSTTTVSSSISAGSVSSTLVTMSGASTSGSTGTGSSSSPASTTGASSTSSTGSGSTSSASITGTTTRASSSSSHTGSGSSQSSSTTQRSNGTISGQSTTFIVNSTTTTSNVNATRPKDDEKVSGVAAYIIVIAVLVPLAIIGTIALIVCLKHPKVAISPGQNNLVHGNYGYEMNNVSN